MPQPYFVPVRPTCSRITHKSGVFGSTSTCCALPLMLRRIMRGFLPWWSGRVYCRPLAAAPQAVSLLGAETGDVVDEKVDVLVGERLRGCGHVAVELAPLPRLERAQLRAQIVVVLTREPRNLLLAEKPRSVALRAVELLRELRPRARAFRAAAMT